MDPFQFSMQALKFGKKVKQCCFSNFTKKEKVQKILQKKKKEQKEQKNISTRQLLNKGNFKKQNCPSSSYP